MRSKAVLASVHEPFWLHDAALRLGAHVRGLLVVLCTLAPQQRILAF